MLDNQPIRIGMTVPQIFYPDQVDPTLISSFVTRAETLGCESLWGQERIIGGVDSLEPINLLSYVSALTQTIKLGTSVLVASTRNPIMLAKELTTLDHLSDGRLIVGIGLGGRVEQYHLFGAPSEHRVRFFMESIRVLKSLWEQPEAHFPGSYWELGGEQMNPKPVQTPHPPIWIGGIHPNVLRRSAKYGDGWMGNGNSSTNQFRSQVEILTQALEEEGRDLQNFQISKRVYIGVDNDENKAKRRMADYFSNHYGVNPERAGEVSITGNTEQCVDLLSDVVHAGAQMLMLNPAYDYLEQMEILAEEVIPKLTS